MSSHGIRWFSIIAAVVALATMAFGWVGVVVVAAVSGAATPWLRLREVWIGLAAVIAWGSLLAWQAAFAGAGAVAGVVGAMLGVPRMVPVVVTLALAFVLAWTAGTVGSAGTQLTHFIRAARSRAT